MSDVVVVPESHAAVLRFVETARAALADAKSIEDVTTIRDQAEAIRYWAQVSGQSLETVNLGTEIRLRADRRAGELLRETIRHEGGRPEKPSHGVTVSAPRTADLGLTRTESSRMQQIAAVPEETFEKAIAETKAKGERLTSAVIRNEIRERKREAVVQAVGASPALPVGEYDVLYVDPPWRYEHVETENRAIENQYPTMSLDEICRMKVPAADAALMFMWATSPKLAEALRVVEAWGFDYRTNMVWVKDRIGMGYYARQRHELLLIAKRGEFPVPAVGDRPDSVIEAARGEHSAKPGIVYGLIERMYPNARRVELFARNRRDGWAAWGNQA